jgi:hypothetical protein
LASIVPASRRVNTVTPLNPKLDPATH